jgi:plasmid stability protein
MAQDLVPVVIRMPADLHAAIKERAAAEERSMAQEIRHALREHTNGSARKRRPKK